MTTPMTAANQGSNARKKIVSSRSACPLVSAIALGAVAPGASTAMAGNSTDSRSGTAIATMSAMARTNVVAHNEKPRPCNRLSNS